MSLEREITIALHGKKFKKEMAFLLHEPKGKGGVDKGQAILKCS